MAAFRARPTASVRSIQSSGGTGRSTAGRTWLPPHQLIAASCAAEVKRQLYTDLFYVDPANAEAIERILKLAADSRIPLFWVLFPLSPRLQSLRDQSGAEDLHEQFRANRSWAGISGIVTVLDARRSGYPASFFADATHLNRHGALALSRSVAAAVAAREVNTWAAFLQASWILWAHQPRALPDRAMMLEDVDESKHMVRPDLPPACRPADDETRNIQSMIGVSSCFWRQ